LEGKPKIFDLGDLPRGPHNYPERYFWKPPIYSTQGIPWSWCQLCFQFAFV
jgi:hypothetical protein